MKPVPYKFPHMIERTNAVKDIWIKDYEKKRRSRIISIIPPLMGYSFGFWAGGIGHTIGFWLFTVIISLALWLFFRYLRDVYKMNI